MGTIPTTPSLSKSNGCAASATGECIAKTDRLIAAAPRMLEFIRSILKPDDLTTNAEELVEWYECQARAILRDVEGDK